MVDIDETKPEPSRDVSEESVASSPEPDGEQPQEQTQVQKRKGGRKPIYATSEERKQRNRQAQAAFRERRTEYIKQLETTIKHHEETLQSLQQSHRSAADECLMLRYKNSLLERILLEKGIDVQAELRAKTGSPNLPPVRMPTVSAPPQPVQRVSVNKGHQPRRYITHAPPKVDTTPQLNPQLPESIIPNPSPRSNPTPTASHFSSPATAPTRSPNFFPQGGSVISPSLGPLSAGPPRHSQPPLRPNLTPMQPPQRPTLATSYTSSGGVTSNSAIAGGHPGSNSAPNKSTFYPNAFQSHLDQLEQEYDAAADMVDDTDVQSPQAPGPFPQGFPTPGSATNGQHHAMQAPQSAGSMTPQSAGGMAPPPAPNPNHTPFQQPMPNPEVSNGNTYNNNNNNMNTFFDPYDPMLDADPFGLSASMHFPTQFSYDAR